MNENLPIVLTNEEKGELCSVLAKHLPVIRKLLHLSQAGLGERCGISRNRIILIESGKFIMTWSQYTSILLLCSVNQIAKEYIYFNKLVTPKFLQYMQQKGPLNPPEVNININNNMTWSYEDLVNQQDNKKLIKEDI